MNDTQPSRTVRARVTALKALCEGIIEVRFAAADGEPPLPPFTAGAHVDLHLPDAGRRSYSLHNAQSDAGVYALGILREASGRGGSAWIHRHLQVGDVLDLSLPRNNFPLAETAGHSYFVAGGIGITPILSMLRRLKELGGRATLLYCARSRRSAAFTADLEAMAGEGLELRYHFDDERQGPPDLAGFIRGTQASGHLYCCGPAPMLDAFERLCEELGRPHFHVERFKADPPPAAGAAPDDAGLCTVECVRSGITAEVARGSALLPALLEAGVEIEFSCAEGVCGACETTVLAGECDHRDSYLSKAQKQAGKLVMVCVSRCRSDRLVLEA